MPHTFDYGHSNVQKVAPCVKRDDGKFQDLRTGDVYERAPDTLLWPVFSGSVFQYSDGKMFLYTRCLDGQYVWGEIKEYEFSHVTMVKFAVPA